LYNLTIGRTATAAMIKNQNKENTIMWSSLKKPFLNRENLKGNFLNSILVINGLENKLYFERALNAN